ncbi:carboxypeptidase-like regulatory domain-containing protein [uncultured Methanobrevibacter sp.]|uniref:carboxypeptidase-like regulatory domain-containing protein n=1 Tax=uncultured Methanobrevibacter sp. TaxID=253161 RepID=UPI0025DFE888|nr:carboxypeptidase-like regulatory domain-containing protein [uncultured Methanobrevibacter sp.]
MEREQIIVVALIVIVVALLVGVVAMMMPNMMKQNSIIKFKGGDTIKEGDSLKVVLTDANGAALANQKVKVTITDKNKTKDYHSVETNENGVGTIKLDKGEGKYSVTVKYEGNDKYNACNETKKITIEKKEEQATQESSSSSSSPSAYAYKSDGTPMYSQAEVDQYMYNKYGRVNYHLQDNGYVNLDEPGFDDAGHYVGR